MPYFSSIPVELRDLYHAIIMTIQSRRTLHNYYDRFKRLNLAA